jgi:sterol desaturase/sphingolipid hydroxylase (fatty acid hydroxylase superfamily)
MNATVTSIAIGLLVLGAVFLTLERLWPSVKAQRVIRAGYLTDLAYWAFTPLVTRAVTRIAMIIVLIPVVIVLGGGMTLEQFVAGFGPLSRQPLWLQALEMVVLGDFIGYWTHRMFHRGRLWRFHAIHHCSSELDWLSAVRLHPVNDVVGRVLGAAPLVALGFSPAVLAGVVPFLTFHAILLHANLNWSFGPLKTVLSSPMFHRWHHTSADEGRDKNFAGLLPLWDILFGTYYLPGHAPTRFGVEEKVPTGLVGQLLWPFRRAA